MRVELDGGEVIDLGTTETTPTIGIVDYSKRVTDDFGVTTVVERGFARRMSVRLAVPFDAVDVLQRRLANLRATAALWVAHDGFDWLAVRGFYKDFAIDLAMPPLSYCTLEIDGLAASEPFTDPGGDPAPDGRTSTLQVLRPVTVTGSILSASNVAEDDYAAWASGTSYALGARVVLAATHRIYESAAAANVGNDPAGFSGKWLDIGPTNRWAMFDQALGTLTASTSQIVVTLAPGGPIGALAAMDIDAATVRVQVVASGVTVYDATKSTYGGAARLTSILFLDLPSITGATITVTVAGYETYNPASIGTLLIGRLAPLGITEAAPTSGITDYSRKELDDFGEVTIVQRAWAKRMTARALIRTDAVDLVASRIAAARAQPSLWIGRAGLDSLTVYGFFKDFSIEVGENVSKVSLSIEGLSTAAKATPLTASVSWPNVTDPDGTKPDDNADVTGEHTSADTNAVGGTPAATVLAASGASIELIEANQAAIQAVSDQLDTTRGELDAAEASLVAVQAGLASATTAITLVETLAKVRGNLVSNGGLERGLAGLLSAPAGFYVDQTNAWGAILYSATASGTGGVAWPGFAVNAGAWYTLAADTALLAASGSVYVDLIFYDGANNALLDGPEHARLASHDFSTDGSGRAAIAVEAQAPVGAAYAVPRFIYSGLSAATFVGIRELKAERGRLPATAFSSDRAPFDTNARVTQIDTARASGEAAAASRFVAVESRVTDTEGVADSAYAGFTSLTDTVATNEAAQAIVNTGLTARVGDSESNYTTLASTLATETAAQGIVNTRLTAQVGVRANLVRNGNFERGLEGISAGTEWSLVTNSNWGSVLLAEAAASVGTVSWPSFPAVPGATYTIAADSLKVSPTGFVYVDILFYDASSAIVLDGPQSTYADAHDFAEGAVNRDPIAVQAVAPAGTAYGVPRFVWSGVPIGSLIGVRKMKVERGPLPWTAYQVADANFASTYADIATNALTIAGTNEALASLDTTITAQVQTAQDAADTAQGTADGAATGVTTAFSQISALSIVVADNDTTASEQITTLTSRIDTSDEAAVLLEATVTQHAGTLVTLTGKVQSYFSVEAVAGTSVGRMSIIASDGVGGTFSQILLDADDVVISGNLLIGGSVNTIALADRAVSDTQPISFTGGEGDGTAGGYVPVASLTITLAATDQLVLLVNAVVQVNGTRSGGGITNVRGFARLLRNGSIIRNGLEFASGAADIPDTSAAAIGEVTIIRPDVPGAGTFTYELQIYGPVTGGSGTLGGSYYALDGTMLPIKLKR